MQQVIILIHLSRVTIADVAREAGVSKQTVSRVLNNKDDVSSETRRRVQAIIEQLDYRPNNLARNLASRRSILIGLIVPGVEIPLFPEIIRGVEYVAEQNHYNLILKNLGSNHEREREREALAALDDLRVDGMILCLPRLADEDLAGQLRNFKAAVLINYHSTAALADHVSVINVDSYRAMTRLLEQLYRAGRRHFVYLNSQPPAFPANERKRAFVNTLSQLGLALQPAQIITGDNTADFGYQAANHVLDTLPETDTIITYADSMAIGVLKACDERGVAVPDAVAVTGFDDADIAAYTIPALTTVRVPRFEMGVSAAQMIFDRLENRPVERLVSINPQLICRESTPELRQEPALS